MDIFFKNNNIPKLSEEQKNLCDKPITEKEILETIKNLATGKTDGSDSLPADFISSFGLTPNLYYVTICIMLLLIVN